MEHGVCRTPVDTTSATESAPTTMDDHTLASTFIPNEANVGDDDDVHSFVDTLSAIVEPADASLPSSPLPHQMSSASRDVTPNASPSAEHVSDDIANGTVLEASQPHSAPLTPEQVMQIDLPATPILDDTVLDVSAPDKPSTPHDPVHITLVAVSHSTSPAPSYLDALSICKSIPLPRTPDSCENDRTSLPHVLSVSPIQIPEPCQTISEPLVLSRASDIRDEPAHQDSTAILHDVPDVPTHLGDGSHRSVPGTPADRKLDLSKSPSPSMSMPSLPLPQPEVSIFPVNSSVSDESCTEALHQDETMHLTSPFRTGYRENLVSLLTQLDFAHSKITVLQSSRDAMSSSIDSLKALLENERAITRAAKRQATDSHRKLLALEHTCALSQNHAAQVDILQARLYDLETQLADAKRHAQATEERLRAFRSQIGHPHDDSGKLGADSTALIFEQTASKDQFSELLKRLEESNAVNRELTSRVRQETSRAEHASIEIDELRCKVASLDAIASQRECLLAKQGEMENERRVFADAEEGLRNTIVERDAQIEALRCQLNVERGKVSELKVAASESATLQLRVKELERDLKWNVNIQNIGFGEEEPEDDLYSKPFSAEMMQSRLTELKDCRAVIVEKDRVLAEVRTDLAEAEKLTMDAIIARNSAAERVTNLEATLLASQNELADARLLVSGSDESRRELEAKLSHLESSISESQNEMSVVDLIHVVDVTEDNPDSDICERPKGEFPDKEGENGRAIEANANDLDVVDSDTDDATAVDANADNATAVDANTDDATAVDANMDDAAAVDANTDNVTALDSNTDDATTVDANTDDATAVDSNTDDDTAVDANMDISIVDDTTEVDAIEDDAPAVDAIRDDSIADDATAADSIWVDSIVDDATAADAIRDDPFAHIGSTVDALEGDSIVDDATTVVGAIANDSSMSDGATAADVISDNAIVDDATAVDDSKDNATAMDTIAGDGNTDDANAKDVDLDDAEAEAQRLRILLSNAHVEISRLRGELRSDGRHSISTVDEIVSTSPCSIDGNANAGLNVPRMQYKHSESLADMEAAANTPPCGISNFSSGSKSHEKIFDGASGSQVEVAYGGGVDSLAICVDKEEHSGKPDTRAAARQEVLLSLEREMEVKVRQCKAMECHIEDTLSPSLQAAKSKLQEKIVELSQVRSEYASFKENVNISRVNLEKEVGNTSKQLEQTIAELQSTKQRLCESEKSVFNQREELQRLSKEKQEWSEVVDKLQLECDHRHGALVALRQRLVVLEKAVGDSEQNAHDSLVEKDRLMVAMREEKDRREVAEQRAARKDCLLHSMEMRNRDLVKEHASVKMLAQASQQQLEIAQRQVHDLEQALRENKVVLQEHAQNANYKEKEHVQTITQLNAKIRENEQVVNNSKHELGRVDKRAKSLSESLASLSVRLRTSETALYEMKRKAADNNKDFQSKDGLICELENKLSSSQSETSAVKKELSHQKQHADSLRVKLTEKEREVIVLTDEKFEMEKHSKALTTDLQFERSSRQSENARMEVLKDEVDNLKIEVDGFEKELEIRTSEAEAMNISYSRAQKKAIHSEQTIRDLQGGLDKKDERVQMLEKLIMDTREELSSLKRHVSGHDTLVLDHKEKEGLLTAKEAELSRANSNIAQMNGRLKVLEAKIEEHNDCRENLCREICALEHEKAELENDLQDVREEAEDSKRIWSTEVEQLKSELTCKVQQLSKIYAQLAESESRNERLQHADCDKENRLEPTNDKALESLKQWCYHISDKLRASEREVMERVSDLQVFTEAFRRLESRLQHMNEVVHAKSSQMRAMKRCHEMEMAKLQWRLDVLRTEDLYEYRRGGDDVYDQLIEFRVQLKIRELDLSDSRATNRVLEKCVKQCEQDLVSAEHRIDVLNGFRFSNDGLEEQQVVRHDSNVFSASQVLLADLSRAEVELRTLKQQLAKPSPPPVKGMPLCTVLFTLRGVSAPSRDVTVYLIGADVTLGDWNIARRVALRVQQLPDDEFDHLSDTDDAQLCRVCQVVVPANVVTKYKYLADGKNKNKLEDSFIWEGGQNRMLTLNGETLHTVEDVWCNDIAD